MFGNNIFSYGSIGCMPSYDLMMKQSYSMAVNSDFEFQNIFSSGFNLNPFGNFSSMGGFSGFNMPSFSMPNLFSGFGMMPSLGFSGLNFPAQPASTPSGPSNPPAQSGNMSPDLSGYSADASGLKAKWGKKAPHLSDVFYAKTARIADKLKCDPHALMAVMAAESGFSPTAKNPKGSATGIIQFTERTANGLGTSTAALKRMSLEKQLDYVEKHILGAKKSAGYSSEQRITAGTVYALVFLPEFAGREVLTTRGSRYYNQNSVLDYNKDGKITKGDLFSVMKKRVS